MRYRAYSNSVIRPKPLITCADPGIFVRVFLQSSTYSTVLQRGQMVYFKNKKCHKHVTNAPKGIGLAQDTFEER